MVFSSDEVCVLIIRWSRSSDEVLPENAAPARGVRADWDRTEAAGVWPIDESDIVGSVQPLLAPPFWPPLCIAHDDSDTAKRRGWILRMGSISGLSQVVKNTRTADLWDFLVQGSGFFRVWLGKEPGPRTAWHPGTT